ncbi:LysR family transcriptional regulator [Conexibacter sp. CPCC 206217]|uniref:LysR family transcriptional regulator n=1 Tax=Conexibacter sp. CPCC 206217 TaxID=3064574 RepID=UPI00271F8C87|nr:LysR family transcriptional regulator [Conexibacter sp. CPCC 206217]MDO8212151.1 LysR family transcriptional regulator [Conexibacter sp. CPCC 206217]
MRIEQLEYIAAVTRLGSFRRAAEELHISQPALSETIRNLERELGVEILDRRRSGAKISDEGRELLPHMISVLEAVDRLRRTAGDHHSSARTVRVGAVNSASTPLLAPAIRAFRERHPATQVELIGTQQEVIQRLILDGGVDLGLVSYLEGDDLPPELDTSVLVRGRPVLCMRPDSPLAARAEIHSAELLEQPLIVMRSGYTMHRFVHRLLAGRVPAFPYATDGAELGKLMVAQGLGVTVLADFSVIGDPLERSGEITWRPLADSDTSVLLVIQRPRSSAASPAARDLREIFVARARGYEAERARDEAAGDAAQRKPVAAGRGDSGLAGSSPVGSSSL